MTKLSLTLRAWRSIMFSFIFLLPWESRVIPSVRDFTDSLRALFSVVSVTTCCWLNSRDSLNAWNSLWRISIKDSLAPMLDSLWSIESKISPKLLVEGDTVPGESSGRLLLVHGVAVFAVAFPMTIELNDSSMYRSKSSRVVRSLSLLLLLLSAMLI